MGEDGTNPFGGQGEPKGFVSNQDWSDWDKPPERERGKDNDRKGAGRSVG